MNTTPKVPSFNIFFLKFEFQVNEEGTEAAGVSGLVIDTRASNPKTRLIIIQPVLPELP